MDKNANQIAANQIIEHDRLTSGDQFMPKGWYWHDFSSKFAGPRILRLPAIVRAPVFFFGIYAFIGFPVESHLLLTQMAWQLLLSQAS